MIKIEKKYNCCGCGACYNICPKKAIEMKSDKEGFKYPVVNKEKCINCGLCQKICPIINNYFKNNKNNKSNNINTIAAYSKDIENRNSSSSGGVFSEIAKYIIEEKKGIVYGAGFDEKFNLKHKKIIDVVDLSMLKGSKYIQSDTLRTFEETKKYLEQGVYILYSGTPCQIAGLKSYLKKDYATLYTCDIICHGVPSLNVFKKYVEELKKKYNSDIKSIYFKDKKYGWNKSSMKIEFKNGKIYFSKLTEDKFMQCFLSDLCLRPSCYKCKFSTLPRCADISLGDFWGIEKKYSEFDDNKGTSLILLNNEKGTELFNKIKKNLFYMENINLKFAIKNNPCINSHVKKNKKRKKFFSNLYEKNLTELLNENIKKESKLKITIYKILSKVKCFLRVLKII